MKITVVIPTKERVQLLLRAIKSLETQTVLPDQIVVINDSKSKLPAHLSEVARITLVESNQELGAAYCRNLGCQVAKGDYIMFLDDDDVMLPDYIGKVIHVIKENNDADNFYWTGVRVIDESSKDKIILDEILFTSQQSSILKRTTDALSIGTGYGLTCKKQSLINIGLFNSGYQYVEDTDLIIRLLESRINPIPIHGVNVEVSKHSEQQLTSSRFNQQRADECRKLLSDRARFFELCPEAESQLFYQIEYLEGQ